jgi:hypothetical protein
MKKIYFFAITLFMARAAGAQTVNTTDIDISAVDDALTLQAIDVATAASSLAAPLLWYDNPFKDLTFDTAEISFDVFNYGPIHVLGSLIAFFDVDSGQGRMYFTNGSYLGYNAMGGWLDANLLSYAVDSDFIGNNVWKNVRLQFTADGFAMYVDDSMAFDQSSTSVTIAGTLADYSNILTFLKKADTLVFGTGSWWSDNTDGTGNYYDVQYSYLKNILFITRDGSGADTSSIDMGEVDYAFKPQSVDVAACVSPVASPALSFTNPFRDQTFDTAKISFDVYTYMDPDSIHVLGALFSIFDTNGTGRMYFSNGSYLGYNAIGGWFDANLVNYGIGTDFIGTAAWRNVELQFIASGYAMYVDGVMAFDQSSTDITIAGTLADYTNLLTYLQIASSFIIGTGSWWSDNTRGDGTYFDVQYSLLKNISFTTILNPPVAIHPQSDFENSILVSEEYFSITGVRIGTEYATLMPGLYIRREIFSNGAIRSTKIVKSYNQ